MGIAPYRPRTATFHGPRRVGDWRLKRYAIVYGVAELDWLPYDEAWPSIQDALPLPPVAEGRPGVGIAIAHQGAHLHYLIAAWWAHENELPFRVFQRGFGPDETWRPGGPEASICVYDLRVLWFEREAYVRHVMRANPDLDAYLAEGYSGPV